MVENAPKNGAGAPLVLYTVFASTLQNGDEKRGERSLKRFALQDVARELLPKEKVSNCLRWGTSGKTGVDILFTERVGRAHYANLITCGRPWQCPVCAAKISERRRVELERGVDIWRARGGSVFMATFTMQHERNDSLGLLLRDMNLAYRAIKSGRKWATFTKRWELAGNVSSLEITYGNAAGFHPHKHVLFFSERTLNGWDAVTIETELSQRWRLKLGELGQYAHQDIAVKVQIGFGAVARYLTKWGEEPKEKAQPAGAAEWTVVHEMTKANVKAGRTNNTEHYSPFQLLELYKTGAGWAGAVFVEYAKATKGLQQLRWSTGLRELLGLGDELSDEEIAAAQDETAQVIATLPWQVWNQVCKKGLRGLLLEVSHTGKANVIYMFLAAHGIMTDQYKESHPG